MFEPITVQALAAIIAERDEKAAAAAYNQLVRDHGHDGAEQIFESALQLVDVAKLTHLVTELERNPGFTGLLNPPDTPDAG